jgi:hypothetical protein
VRSRRGRGPEGVREARQAAHGSTLAPLPALGGTAHGCVADVPRALVRAIAQTPSSYYVNVHSSEFPDGAIRGQLAG